MVACCLRGLAREGTSASTSFGFMPGACDFPLGEMTGTRRIRTLLGEHLHLRRVHRVRAGALRVQAAHSRVVRRLQRGEEFLASPSELSASPSELSASPSELLACHLAPRHLAPAAAPLQRNRS